LFAAFVVAKSMIEVAFLPNDAVLMPLVMFPITDDATHGFVAMEGQEGVDVIWHQHENREVPTVLPIV